MSHKFSQPIQILRSLFLALLIAFPPVFQSIHGAFSHHHLTSCCDHHEGALHQQEEPCDIVSFVFYAQVLPEASPILTSPLNYNRIGNDILPLWLPGDPVSDLNSRAPPVSC